jgi:hypothetical protein
VRAPRALAPGSPRCCGRRRRVRRGDGGKGGGAQPGGKGSEIKAPKLCAAVAAARSTLPRPARVPGIAGGGARLPACRCRRPDTLLDCGARAAAEGIEPPPVEAAACLPAARAPAPERCCRRHRRDSADAGGRGALNLGGGGGGGGERRGAAAQATAGCWQQQGGIKAAISAGAPQEHRST